MSDERLELGIQVRREVHGEEKVDGVFADLDDFTRTFQEELTRFAWGGVWARDGLDRRTRSCISLSILASLGRLDDFALHVESALRNGLTVEEISEVLLQTSVYAGIPAANAAMRRAREVLQEAGEL